MFYFPSDFFLFFFLHIKNALIPGTGWCWLLTMPGHPCVAFDPPAARTIYISFIAHRSVSIIA